MQSLKDRHVVVTGGTGALGSAVVKAFIEAGATCHIPAIESTPPTGHLPDSKQIEVVPSIDLSNEASVDSFYAKLPPLHAVVNIAGGFAYAPIADSPLKVLQQQLSMNVVSCVLSCRAAVANFRKGGDRRPHRQHLRPPRPQSAPGRQHDRLHGVQGRGRGLHRGAGRGAEERRHLGHRLAPSTLDTPANRKDMPTAKHDTWVKPTAIAELIVAHCSLSETINSGAVMPVYGRPESSGRHSGWRARRRIIEHEPALECRRSGRP